MRAKEISLKPLTHAADSLTQAIENVSDDLDRDGAIQRFEYTYELAWKTLKRYFDWNQQKTIDSVKDIWREAAKQGFITDLELYFSFHQARNLTSHLYSAKVANETYAKAKVFAKELGPLIQKLQDRVD